MTFHNSGIKKRDFSKGFFSSKIEEVELRSMDIIHNMILYTPDPMIT